MYHYHLFPCLHCHPHSYIRMIQHLIERCLLLRMSQDGCIKALAEHASIEPHVTLTVWKELVKENRGFFHHYFRHASPRPYGSKNLHIAVKAHEVQRDSEEETIGGAEIEPIACKQGDAASELASHHHK